jgi:hypothetical protein
MFSSSFTMSQQEHRRWTPYKHFGMRLLERGDFVIDRARHKPMQVSATALEQSLVGCVPNESVLESVVRFGRNSVNVDEFGISELAQTFLQLLFGIGWTARSNS